MCDISLQLFSVPVAAVTEKCGDFGEPGNLNEGPTYEVIELKKGESPAEATTQAKGEEITLTECPAYGPVNAGDQKQPMPEQSNVYETVSSK